MMQATFPTYDDGAYALHQKVERLMNGRKDRSYIWSAEPIGGRMVSLTIRADQLPEKLNRIATPTKREFRVGDIHPFSFVAQCVIRMGPKNQRLQIDIHDDARRYEWLRRRAYMNGFSIVESEIASVETIFIDKRGAQHKTDRTRFEGKLRVVDPQKFATAIRFGIGHGKSFGLGLLDIS